MASIKQDGTAEQATVFPWKLRFAPTGKLKFADTVADGYKDFMADLATIPVGSTLYDIYAMHQPAELGGIESLIGQLVTDS